MTDAGPKADLQRYLQTGRDALLWKLEGLSEYDVRRPMTPTGTNLLGLVKHLAYVEMGYFGADVRPAGAPRSQPWIDDDVEPNCGHVGDRGRSRARRSSALYRRAWAHADATIEALPLDARRVGCRGGSPTAQAVTLHQVLVHVIAETHRHAGHADIVRELIDGAAGLRADNDNLPPASTRRWWAGYRDRLETGGARQAAGAA